MTFKKKDIGIFPEIATGIGQLLDITGLYSHNLYEKYLNTNSDQLDREALQSDWKAVGLDIASAMDIYGKKIK